MSNIESLDDRVSLRAASVFALVVLAGFGLLYSLAGTGVGRVLFPAQATGSMLARDGVVVGSAWVGQPFEGAGWFQPRPSAAGYDPMAAAGSNMARGNPELRSRIGATVAAVAQRDGIAPGDVPADLATRSGSGLDPHVSPAGAQVQVARVARARGMDPAAVRDLVAAHTEPARFGLLGQPRVNVLRLNLALEAMAAARAPVP